MLNHWETISGLKRKATKKIIKLANGGVLGENTPGDTSLREKMHLSTHSDVNNKKLLGDVIFTSANICELVRAQTKSQKLPCSVGRRLRT